MKVLVVGSRDFPDLGQVQRFVKALPVGTHVLSGGARGVDATAETAALVRGLSRTILEPAYHLYPRNVAPLKRNDELVALADEIHVFWDGVSRGSSYVITQATMLKKPYVVHLPWEKETDGRKEKDEADPEDARREEGPECED